MPRAANGQTHNFLVCEGAGGPLHVIIEASAEYLLHVRKFAKTGKSPILVIKAVPDSPTMKKKPAPKNDPVNQSAIAHTGDLADAWVRVRLAALRTNLRLIKEQIAAAETGAPKLMAVVKADAYGHGAGRVAAAFREAGADAFGVTTLLEAIEICEAGIDSEKTPVLVFAPMVSNEQLRAALSLNLHLTICNEEQAGMAARAAASLKVVAALHLKVDTGMGRLGLPPEQALTVARSLEGKKNARLAGVYTHFSRAGEENLAPTRAQMAQFDAFCRALAGRGVHPEMRHAANSAAAMRLPESRLDMVRVGTLLYGQYPSGFVPKIEGLRDDTWIMQARVIFAHELPAGSTVGYGAETRVRRLTRAAVLPVGFADGFAVSPNSLFRGARGLRAVLKGEPPFVWIQGRKAPVLGRVAMQMIVVDTTDLPQPVRAGDVADIPARRLSASARLPRIYSED